MKAHLYDWIRKLNLSRTQLTIILASVYVFFSLTANIAATKVTYFGKFVMDAGIIYSLTFTWRDLIHKQLGKSAALTTIYVSAIINFLAAIYFQLAVLLPAETQWAAAGGQVAWEFLFGLQIRIVLGSILAMIIAEVIDTYVYHYWTTGIGRGKPHYLRVFISNGISIPIDSIVFPIIAFLGILDWGVIFQMFIAGVIVKFALTIISFWMIYLVPDKPVFTRRD
ncbi:queuosine precursor transporter [Candidatus Woesearchaeota archaeon]|nr:queuosine precursor transporter [Candidatus Woesearchaeota archaeon]